MKWAYSVKDKIKAAAVLTVIICVVLFTNFTERRGFNNLGRSITSIYEDRLLPATYIFEITDHLYQKRLLQGQYMSGGNNNTTAGIQQHNAAISSLMQRYETTYLTPEEKTQWTAFKQHFDNYNQQEAGSLAAANALPAGEQYLLEQEFNRAILSLNALSSIQAGEGSHLHKNATAIIGSNTILSDLEITLLIILGLFALVLLSVRDKAIFHNSSNAGLN